MGDVMDALQHRAKRRDLGWSESADLADFGELSMKWYLRGEFAPPEGSAALSGGAAIAGPMTAAEASALAEKLGAAALLPVFE